jgi:glycosyltransferase involved in cell wall biosynthesis
MPINVLHAINMVGANAGGPTRVLIDMTKAQVALGYNVTVVTTDRDLPSTKGVDEAEIRKQFAPEVRLLFFPVDFRPLLVSFRMGRWLNANISSFDIVHVHGCYRYPATMTARAARLANVPFIIRPHGTFDPFLINKSSKSVFLKRLYEKMLDFPNFRRASAIHCTSNEELHSIQNLNFGSNAFVVSNGLDWSIYEHMPERGSFRSRFLIEPEIPLLLFLGRLNFKKGLDLLIPAFAMVRHQCPKAQLVIAGPDNEGYGKIVHKMVVAAGLEDHVIFTGQIYGQEILAAYQDSDLFVLPSYGENFGMTVIEALAAGTPVVISDKVNIFEDVVASGAGIAVSCMVEPLAGAMIDLINDPTKRAVMAKAARPWVKAKFAWSSIVRDLDFQYLNVLERAATVEIAGE